LPLEARLESFEALKPAAPAHHALAAGFTFAIRKGDLKREGNETFASQRAGNCHAALYPLGIYTILPPKLGELGDKDTRLLKGL